MSIINVLLDIKQCEQWQNALIESTSEWEVRIITTEYDILWSFIDNIWSVKNKNHLNGNDIIITTTYNCCFNCVTYKLKDLKNLKNLEKRHIKILYKKFICTAHLKAQFFAVNNENEIY